MPPSRILLRLARHYLSNHWGVFGLAITCMLITSAASASIPAFLDFTIKHIFIQRQAALLLPVALAVIAIMTVRAASWYGANAWWRPASATCSTA